jgi:hypothetical protein
MRAAGEPGQRVLRRLVADLLAKVEFEHRAGRQGRRPRGAGGHRDQHKGNADQEDQQSANTPAAVIRNCFIWKPDALRKPSDSKAILRALAHQFQPRKDSGIEGPVVSKTSSTRRPAGDDGRRAARA